jgi:membrane-associated phospholipid phosphatase
VIGSAIDRYRTPCGIVVVVRSAEWVACVYFVYLAGVCWLVPLSRPRQLFITVASLATAAATIGAFAATPFIREWAPLVYILVGYFLTGRLFVAPSARLEQWLLGWDHRLLGDPTTRFSRWPGWLVAYLDAVYTFCFLLLPAGLVVLKAGGRSDLANHYWTMVVAAELGAFASLSFFQTRPPWMVEPAPQLAARSVHHVASLLVQNVTIRANTFPSGHVAASFAIALAVAGAMPVAGGVLFALAASIAVACVVGRYHYVVDVAAGLALAGLVWAVVVLGGI